MPHMMLFRPITRWLIVAATSSPESVNEDYICQHGNTFMRYHIGRGALSLAERSRRITLSAVMVTADGDDEHR